MLSFIQSEILNLFSVGWHEAWASFSSVYLLVVLIAVALIAYRIWLRYIVAAFVAKMEWVLLEIKLPKETYKSPKAMEVVLAGFHQTPGINFYEKNYLGKSRQYASLEIASINGSIHFFIRVLKNLRVTTEAHIYSQYPTAEIHEVSDYTRDVPYLSPDSKWNLFGTELKLTKEDAYPIKTYVDYGLGDDPKEEFKVDPMTSLLEFMGSVGQGEQVWYQVNIMAAEKRFLKPGTWFTYQDWKEDAKTLITKLLKRDKLKEGMLFSNEMLLSPGERTVIEAVERQISKLGFDCGIRMMYLAEGDKFNGSNIGALMSSYKQYNSQDLNGFRPVRVTKYEPWEDIFGTKLKKLKQEFFEVYCRRGWFYPPYDRVPFVLNSEELATVYHFPGAVAATPTFGRSETKRGEAPVNLPI